MAFREYEHLVVRVPSIFLDLWGIKPGCAILVLFVGSPRVRWAPWPSGLAYPIRVR
jgi:hypothetical protein